MHARVFELLGFVPVRLDVKELRGAVENGTVDAQENPLTNTYNFDIHKHHRYITLSGHFFGVATLLCHNPTFQAWPVDAQKAVMDAAKEATAVQRQLAAAEDAEIMAKLDPSANEVILLTDAERAAFVQAVAPVVNEQRKKFGKELLSYFD